jgi:hypothetical protein
MDGVVYGAGTEAGNAAVAEIEHPGRPLPMKELMIRRRQT